VGLHYNALAAQNPRFIGTFAGSPPENSQKPLPVSKVGLKQEWAGKPDAPDRKRMEELVNEAFDKVRNQDEALLRVQREHDQVVSHWECHYYGSARVYCAIGRALAEAMLALQPRP